MVDFEFIEDKTDTQVSIGFHVGDMCMEEMNKQYIVDLHSHVLPQMDDGSQDVQTSVQMLKTMDQQGVRTVCATSHYYARQEDVGSFLRRRREAADRLQEGLGHGTDFSVPQILLGAEVAYFPGVSRCAQLSQLCLQGTQTLLLELSYTPWTPEQVEEVARLSLDLGYQVILAHPERFSHMRSYWRDMERMLFLPIALQINADSLLHWRSRGLALELLSSTSRPLLASDCHNLTIRAPRLEKARTVVRKKLGEKMLIQIDETALHFIQPVGETFQEAQP